MWYKYFSLFFAGVMFGLCANAQKIDYSVPEKDDIRSVNFEIIGKLNGHYLVYKNVRTNYFISIFDDNMKLIEKKSLDFLPERIINSDIIRYKDYFYFIYQYQKKNLVHCMAAKMDGDGRIVGQPKELDTTLISFFANNKIYTIINSEDKQKIGVFKINTKNPQNYAVTIAIFDADLHTISKNSVGIPINGRNDFLTEFELDNDGGLVFVRASGTTMQNEFINNITLITKEPQASTTSLYTLNISNIYLDDIRVKVDNANKHYLITSFYTKQRKGNIEGLYCMLWDKSTASQIITKNIAFTDELRNNAKNEGSTKLAFNDFFIQNILIRKDGGFAIASEASYSSTRGIYSNRWDNNYGSPYWSASDYYLWGNSFGGYYYPWWRSGYYNTQTTRYFADNVVILSFDSTSKLQWSNVIRKSQYDDNTDNFIGYGTFKTGSQVNFLFNQSEKRNLLLSVQTISADGQITRSPTLRNLDRGYIFMPRYVKQVSSTEVIAPCQYRNYICFAKIVF